MTITITPEIEDILTVEARKYGTTPELLALETLRERYAERLRIGSNGHTDGDSLTLDVALADLIAEAEALELQIPRPGLTEPFGEILACEFIRRHENANYHLRTDAKFIRRRKLCVLFLRPRSRTFLHFVARTSVRATHKIGTAPCRLMITSF